MLGAHKQKDGKYTIVDRPYIGPRCCSTYHYRHKLNEYGGNWNLQLRVWQDIDEKFLKELHASKHIQVKIKPFPGCNKESIVNVYEDEIKNNQISILDWSDDRIWVDIVENLGEI